MTIGEPQSIMGETSERNGKTEENEGARIARHLLDLHLLDTEAVREGGSRRLYYDPRRRQYWEAVYVESGKFGEGPPSLIPVSADDVEDLYGIEPFPAGEKITITAARIRAGHPTEAFEQAEKVHDQPGRIMHHLADSHLIKAGAERDMGSKELYRDPVDDSYYMVYVEHATEPAPGGGTTILSGPLKLVELSYAEVVESYGCGPLMSE